MVKSILANPQSTPVRKNSSTMDLQRALDEERGVTPNHGSPSPHSSNTPPPRLRQPLQASNPNDSGLDSLVKQMNKVNVKASSPEKVKPKTKKERHQREENYITKYGRIVKQPDRYKS